MHKCGGHMHKCGGHMRKCTQMSQASEYNVRISEKERPGFPRLKLRLAVVAHTYPSTWKAEDGRSW